MRPARAAAAVPLRQSPRPPVMPRSAPASDRRLGGPRSRQPTAAQRQFGPPAGFAVAESATASAPLHPRLAVPPDAARSSPRSSSRRMRLAPGPEAASSSGPLRLAPRPEAAPLSAELSSGSVGLAVWPEPPVRHGRSRPAGGRIVVAWLGRACGLAGCRQVVAESRAGAARILARWRLIVGGVVARLGRAGRLARRGQIVAKVVVPADPAYGTVRRRRAVGRATTGAARRPARCRRILAAVVAPRGPARIPARWRPTLLDFLAARGRARCHGIATAPARGSARLPDSSGRISAPLAAGPDAAAPPLPPRFRALGRRTAGIGPSTAPRPGSVTSGSRR